MATLHPASPAEQSTRETPAPPDCPPALWASLCAGWKDPTKLLETHSRLYEKLKQMPEWQQRANPSAGEQKQRDATNHQANFPANESPSQAEQRPPDRSLVMCIEIECLLPDGVDPVGLNSELAGLFRAAS